MIQKLRKKPVEIEGVQWNGNNRTEIELFVGKSLQCSTPPTNMEHDKTPPNESYTIIIPTLEGNMIANRFDWILKGVAGEFYPCNPDIKDRTYDVI